MGYYSDIRENNKLIATVIGYQYIPSDLVGGAFAGWWKNGKYKHFKHTKIEEYLGRTHNSLNFDNDWNYLMLAVEQLQELDVNIIIDEDCSITYGGEYYESTNSMENCKFNVIITEGTLKEKIYQAITEFCKWYNENFFK